MSIDLFPKYILDNYEIHQWKHACAILNKDFPQEFKDIVNLLSKFKLKKSWITSSGGRKSKVSEFIDSFLLEKGWVEKQFTTKVLVDEYTLETPTHRVDCFKIELLSKLNGIIKTHFSIGI